MILLDANVLIYAHRQDTDHHEKYRKWLENLVNGNKSFGISDSVLSAVIRVTTHTQIFKNPSSLKEVLAFVEQIRHCPQCFIVTPGPKHWDTFLSLIRSLKITGNDVPDAYLAALAIEWDYEFITTDQGFARFKLLKWRHPFNL